MRNPDDWRFPTSPHSRHPASEQTRRSAREHVVAKDIDSWRTATRYRRGQAPKRSGAGGKLLRAATLLLGLLAVAFIGSGWLLNNAYEGRILPQVVAGNVPVGSLTPVQASQKIEQQLEPYLEAPVTLRLGEKSWQPSAEEIGLTVDVEETVERALKAGRDRGTVPVLIGMLLGRERPVTVPYVASLDNDQLDLYLSDIGGQVNQDPAGPQVRVTGNDVSVEGGGSGYTFLKPETQTRVVRTLSAFSRAPVEVQILSSAGPVSSEEVARSEETARRILSGPLALESRGQRWELSRKQLGDWLRSEVRKDREGTNWVEVFLDPVALQTYLERLASQINQPPVNARLQFVDGELQVARPSAAGEALDVPRAVQVVQDAAAGKDRLVALPTRRVTPEIDEASLSTLGVEELIAEGGVSGFADSPPERLANIRSASDAITGYVVQPGEEFSFTEALGRVSEDRGFQPELIGNGERGFDGPWAGISQVSTTVFRAALQAGLPILERHPAPHRVPYFELEGQKLGTEAIVTLPGQDLRFDNNTRDAILIQVLVGERDMRVELYGRRPAYSVEIIGPEIANTIQPEGDVYWEDSAAPTSEPTLYARAASGGDVTVVRRIRDGENESEDPFFSRYDPLPTIFVRGSLDVGATPTGMTEP